MKIKSFFSNYFGEMYVIVALRENQTAVNQLAKSLVYLPLKSKPGKYLSHVYDVCSNA